MTLWPKGVNLVKNVQSSFFKQRKIIKVFKHWLILTAKGLLQSSELHGGPIGREPDIIQVSWKKRRKTKTICYFIRKHRENPRWFANSYKSHNRKLGRNLVLMLRALEGALLLCLFSVKETALCALGQWGQFSFPSGKGCSSRACWPTMHC